MEKLRICADSITAMDEEMQRIRNMIEASRAFSDTLWKSSESGSDSCGCAGED